LWNTKLDTLQIVQAALSDKENPDSKLTLNQRGNMTLKQR